MFTSSPGREQRPPGHPALSLEVREQLSERLPLPPVQACKPNSGVLSLLGYSRLHQGPESALLLSSGARYADWNKNVCLPGKALLKGIIQVGLTGRALACSNNNTARRSPHPVASVCSCVPACVCPRVYTSVYPCAHARGSVPACVCAVCVRAPTFVCICACTCVCLPA